MNPDRQAWLAAGGDTFRLELYEQVGRVGAFARGDQRILATIHPDRPNVGCLADWTGDRELLTAAERWLASQGCTVAHAPRELCAWFASWANLGPKEPAAFSWEPTVPAEPWLEAGYEPVNRYVSILADHAQQIRAGTKAAARLSAQGWWIAPLPVDEDGHIPDGLFHEALAMVHHLFDAGYAEADGYADVPLELLRAYYGRYRTELDARLTLLAYTPEGEPAGAVLAIPDAAEPERRWFCIMALVVRPEYQQQGVGSWLVAACHKAADAIGYRKGVHALVQLEGKQDTSWFHGDLLRSYALLAKEL